MRKKKVIIVGGGFGGLETAKALGGHDVDVTLLDRTNYHLFQPLLYQVAMAGLSPAEIAAPIRGILADFENVRVELGEVSKVDLAGKRVFVGDAEHPYDFLVLAVGASSHYFGHPEWERWAPSLKTLEDAVEIRRRVLLAFERAEQTTDPLERKRLLTFVVIGGGPTGCELAGAIAELAKFVLEKDFRSMNPKDARVILVEGGPRVLTAFPPDLAQRAVEQLHELGVEVRTGDRVVNIDERGVELQEAHGADDLPGLGTGFERKTINSATVLWGAGVAPSPLTRLLGLPTDRQGRVIVGSDCAVPGHPEVFAIGDMARFEEKGEPLPGVSPVAMQQARYVAKLIRWELESLGAPPRTPFHYFDKGTMATLGRSRAIAWARGIKMSGFIAWLAWLFIHIWYLVGFRSRLVVLLTWTWSYVSYKRGARLITSTGWSATPTPTSSEAKVLPAPAPSPPATLPSPEPARRTKQAAMPTA